MRPTKMAHILVAGLVNIETTVKIEGFPLPYYPVTYPFYGLHSSVSGVGINIAKALYTLGNMVSLTTMVGNDLFAQVVQQDLTSYGIDTSGILPLLDETPESVILYEPSGKRQIHVDLKNIQDTSYPEGHFEQTLGLCDIAVLCNINFSRPWLKKARSMGKLVATDVHVLGNIDDPYNKDFIENSDILFLSDEAIGHDQEAFIRELASISPARWIVMGRGAQGSILYEKESAAITLVPAVTTRPMVSTIGAGDALLSAFVHGIAQKYPAQEALRRATVFASWKIGAASAAEGFLSLQDWEATIGRVQGTRGN